MKQVVFHFNNDTFLEVSVGETADQFVVKNDNIYGYDQTTKSYFSVVLANVTFWTEKSIEVVDKVEPKVGEKWYMNDFPDFIRNHY